MTHTITNSIRCTEALTAGRFWTMQKCVFKGWVLVYNLDTAQPIRIYFNDGGNDTSPYETIKPRHTRPFQVDEGDIVWISSVTNGAQIKIQNATYKPDPDQWYADEGGVENIPYHADAVAVTATYNFTDTATYPTIRKGYIMNVQVQGDVGGFNGTIEVSDDGGVTYSPAAIMDSGDPNKTVWVMRDKILTHVRVTNTGGTFTIDAY